MKIVIAPDSYKGSLTAAEVARAMEVGVRRLYPEAETVLVPMADGGEGTVQALVDATGGCLVAATVTGPLGAPVEATFGILGDGMTAVIEMASASGLPLVSPESRNPMVTTTYGTGELIRLALDHGCTRLIIGIGGSATNDGGAGMAMALGAGLLDARDQAIKLGAQGLAMLERIDLTGFDQRLAGCTVTVACDVDNPMTGPRGASVVFGPQKGATPEMVEQLDALLHHWSEVLRTCLGREVEHVPGSGAAGGLGGGLMALLSATLRPGVGLVAEAVGLRKRMEGAGLCLTGEGRTDEQTAHGKTPMGVAQIAKAYGIPVLCLSGGLGSGYEAVYQVGIDAVMSIVPGPITLQQAVDAGPVLIADAVERTLRVARIGL